MIIRICFMEYFPTSKPLARTDMNERELAACDICASCLSSGSQYGCSFPTSPLFQGVQRSDFQGIITYSVIVA